MAQATLGYQVVNRRGKYGGAFMVRVWDRSARRYGKSKTFSINDYQDSNAAKRAANEWGREQAARKVLEPVFEREQSAFGRCLTQEVLELYVRDRLGSGVNANYMRDMQRRLSSLHQLCPDLNNPQAGQQIYNWWQQWRIEPIGFGNTAKKTGIQHTQKMKSPRTQNHGLSEVKTLVNWAWRSRALTGMRFELDLSFINPVRLEKKLKAQFTIDELAMGLRLHDHPYRVRFALYVYLGARRSEILQLKWSDIEGGMVKLRGKGMKERLTPMQSELATILRVHRRNGAERDGFIFGPSIRCDDGGNLTKRFNSFLKAAGIEKADRTTHSLRHCYAGLMAATGEPTALLQAYMGHSDSEMTTHYAQMAARYRSAVVEWPRGMLKILSTPLKSR